MSIGCHCITTRAGKTYPLDFGNGATGVLKTDLTRIELGICNALGDDRGESFGTDAFLHEWLDLGHTFEGIYETTIEVTHGLGAKTFVVLDATSDDSAKHLARQGR